MAFTEDFTEFFETDDFAITAIHTPDGGSPANVDGVFDNEYLLIDDGEVGIEATAPMFQCAAADVSGVAAGDVLNVNGTNYNIVEVKPDGTGTTFLRLSTT